MDPSGAMSKPTLTPREFAYLSITGPGTHEAITERLRTQPSEAWNAGDANPRTGQPRKSMCWRLRSGSDDTRSLAEHVQSLLVGMSMRVAELRELWADYDLTLQCVGYYPPSSGSGIHFDREVIRQAGQLGLAIDCDHYFVDDHGHDG